MISELYLIYYMQTGFSWHL